MRALSWFSFLGLIFTGCYDVSQDRLVDITEREVQGQTCSAGLKTGCLMGTILAAPEIYVNNQQFEDSEDFALMFSDLVTVESKSGETLSDEAYDIELLSEINNRQFGKGFTIYVRGHETRSLKVSRDGKFYIDYLQPGYYDLYAQRKLSFKVKQQASFDAESGEMVRKATEKVYCATLKSETMIQVYAGEKVTPVLEDFDLIWREAGCKEDAANLGIVTL